jgi:hypothetical protein
VGLVAAGGAGNTRPQPGRDLGSRCPHAEHVCEVDAEGTGRSSDPNRGAL